MCLECIVQCFQMKWDGYEDMIDYVVPSKPCLKFYILI